MKFKKVLVTGGAGYVGAVLVPKLLQNNYQVTVLDSYIFGDQVFAKSKNHPHLIEIKGDLRNSKLVKKVINNVDAVIHLACISNDPSFDLDPALGKSVNYDATIQLVNIAKSRGVKRFIYASSSSVYGVKKEMEVTEDLSLAPLTDYSKYKALSEKYILQQNNKRFAVLIIRPATVCGYSPRLRLDLTVNMLTLQALVNKKITVFGGHQQRPNIHISDITDLYVKSLEIPIAKFARKIYNAGYENQTLLEIAALIKKVLNDSAIQISITSSTDQRSYRISSQKIKQELGFIPQHSIADAVNDLKKAFASGLIPDALINPIYYNIRTLKQSAVKN